MVKPCETIQESLISSFPEWPDDPEERRHIETCPACRARLETLELLASAAEEEPGLGPDFTTDVMRNLEPAGNGFAFFRIAAGLLALFLLGIGTGLYVRRPIPDESGARSTRSSSAPGSLLDEGERLLQTGNLSQALSIGQRLRVERPADSRSLLGRIALEKGDLEEAHDQLTEALRLRPGDRDVLALATCLKRLNRLEEGLPLFKKAVRAGLTAETERRLARILLDAGGGALLLRIWPKEPTHLALEQAVAHLQVGHLDRALAALDRTRETDVDVVRLLLALRSLRAGDRPGALRPLPEPVSPVLETHGLAERPMGQLLQALEWIPNEPERAARLLRPLLSDFPDLVAPILADIDPKAADELAREAKQHKSRTVRLASARASLHAGQLGRAADELKRLLNEAPEDTDALRLRAELRLRRGDATGALADIEKLGEEERSEADVLKVAAEACFQLGAFDQGAGLLLEGPGLAALKDPIRTLEEPERSLAEAACLRLAGRVDEAETKLATSLVDHPDDGRLHLAMARLHHRKGRRGDALQAIHQVLRLRPDDPAGYRLLASLHEEEGVILEARAVLTEALENRDFSPADRAEMKRALLGLERAAERRRSDLMEAARSAIERGDAEKGALLADRLLNEIAYDDPDAYLLKGRAVERMGDPELAERFYRSAVELKGDLPRTHVALGRFLLEQGSAPEALKEARAAAAIDAGHPDALLLEGETLIWLGREMAARNRFDRLIDTARVAAHPHQLVRTHQWLGRLERLNGRLDGAERHISAACSWDPTPASLLLRGWTHLRAGRTDEAARDFETARKRAEKQNDPPNIGRALTALAHLDRLAGRTEAAMARLERALTLAPSAPRTWYELGRTRLLLEDERGAADLESVIELHDLTPLRMAGLPPLNLPDPPRTEKEWKRSHFWTRLFLDHQPFNSRLYARLGRLQEQVGQDEAALRTYSRGLAQNDQDRRLAFALGRLALRVAPGTAVDAFRTCILADPDWGPAHRGLAEALVALNRFEAALEAVEAALRLGLTGSDVEGLRATILEKLGRTEEAKAARKKARRRKRTEHALARELYARALARPEEKQDRALLSRALTLNPDLEDARRLRILMALRDEQPVDALLDLGRLLTDRWLWCLGTCRELGLLDHPERGKRLLGTALPPRERLGDARLMSGLFALLQTPPPSAEIRKTLTGASAPGRDLLLLLLLLREDRLDEAEEKANALLKSHPELAPAWAIEAHLRSERGEEKRAEEAREKARALGIPNTEQALAPFLDR